MSTAPPPLRLAAIKICGYRAFPIPVTLCLATHDKDGKVTGRGKNLLLYGENGSGKSSVGKAVRDFLNVRDSAVLFDDFKYRYSDPPRDDRNVTLTFDDPTVDPLGWTPKERYKGHVDFADMARSRGWLDYRAVWRASEVQYGDSVEIFRPLVEEILPGCLPTTGGTTTFGRLWTKITTAANKNPIKYGKEWAQVDQIQADLKQFNPWLETFLPTLEARANELLKEFVPWTKMKLTWGSKAGYDSAKKRGSKLSNGSVRLQMIIRDGDPLKTPSEFLNEARLTAIGLCLYLAGMSQSIPPKRADGSSYPRLLVLDDVLLSLDMAHRQPLLKILKSDSFKDWQILLLTHDRAWYEIAKQQLEGWAHHELFAQQVGDYEQPILLPDLSHLDRARAFLSPPVGGGQLIDLKAGAEHLRTEFELILKAGCEGLQLPVPFRRNAREVKANTLWSALQNAKLEPFPVKVEIDYGRGKSVIFWRSEKPQKIVPEALQRRVSFALSWVLNPLSHSESIDRHSREVQDAPAALEELSRVVQEAVAQKGQHEALARSTLLSCIDSKAGVQGRRATDV